MKTLNSDVYHTVKEAIVDQIENEKYEAKKELLLISIANNNVQIRQTVAETQNKIPEDFRSEYETFIRGSNHIKHRKLLCIDLWRNFPESSKRIFG